MNAVCPRGLPQCVPVGYRGLFFAMELLAGPTLGNLIRESHLSFNAVSSYALQVVAALKQASQLGLVHGDIKLPLATTYWQSALSGTATSALRV